jgi:hypothetical protein
MVTTGSIGILRLRVACAPAPLRMTSFGTVSPPPFAKCAIDGAPSPHTSTMIPKGLSDSTPGVPVWHRRPRLCSDLRPWLFSASPCLRSEVFGFPITRLPDVPISVPLPPPQVIPDWRRLQRWSSQGIPDWRILQRMGYCLA